MRRVMMDMVAAHADRSPAPLIAEQVKGSGKPGFIDALDALTDYPIRDRLPEISCPTLIVWGTKDRLVPVRDAFEFEELIPGSRAVVWADTGHLPMLERPAAFNDLVERFFDDHAAVVEAEAEPKPPRGGAGGHVAAEPGPLSQFVTAPSAALDTSFAYLPRTPVASGDGGGS